VSLFAAEQERWQRQYPAPAQIRQMAAFRQAVLDRPGATVVELGGGVPGNSTTMFLSAIEDAGGELWSVDLEAAQVPAEWHWLPYWHFLQADDLSSQAQKWLPAEVDVLFIDSDHGYEHTLAELRLYAPRVCAGGVALLHDTQWDTGNIELPEPTGPVARALDDWCAEAGRSWVNLPGSYGLGIIDF
jgi:cephalosporin hydroxylase